MAILVRLHGGNNAQRANAGGGEVDPELGIPNAPIIEEEDDDGDGDEVPMVVVHEGPIIQEVNEVDQQIPMIEYQQQQVAGNFCVII